MASTGTRWNVNGGVSRSATRWDPGSRLITTALHELERRDANLRWSHVLRRCARHRHHLERL